MTKEKPKTYSEDFARFFEEPSREGLREILKNNIGETRICDFKADWPSYDSLSKHILGIANMGGGAIIVGLNEAEDKTIEAIGLRKITDKADISNGVGKYLPSTLACEVQVLDFSYKESEYAQIRGKKFQVVMVPQNLEHLPYLSKKSGSEIDDSIVYIRKEGATLKASHDELQKVINKRIETGYSTRKEMDLKEHLSQLKLLIEQADLLSNSLYLIASGFNNIFTKNNSKTGESYEDFIIRLINLKKKRIEKELDI